MFSRAVDVRQWMFDQALPLWAAKGVDRDRGGFVEQLTLDGQDARVSFKRTRVTARQIYVFSHAAVLGWPQGREIADHGLAFLLDRCWLSERKTFARRVSRDGGLIDPQPDLYDLAFVMFAFAWHYRATGSMASRDWIHRTLDAIEASLRHGSGDGFLVQFPPEGDRLQNPHMHLTEAALVAFEATGEARFSDLAKELISLFERRFFDPITCTLAEYFDEDWRPVAGRRGRIVEPGHQFEWAWILGQARRLLGLDLTTTIRAAVFFAERYGVDPRTSATYNEVDKAGTPLNMGSRVWPNTERLKAAVALHDLDGRDPLVVLETSSALLLDRYLGMLAPGLWVEEFNGEGEPVSHTAPASTFYHLFLAFAEVLRISGK